MTFLAISLWIKNVAGWCVEHWKLLLYIVAGIVILFVLIFAYKGCTRPKPEIESEKVVEIQRGIETHNREVMEKNAAEIKAKQEVIDNDLSGNIKAIDEAESKAKAEVKGMTNQEIVDFLEAQINQ